MFRITHCQTHETRSRQTFSLTLRRKISLHATAVEFIMYNVPDRASRTRWKRYRVRVGLFKTTLPTNEPRKRIYEGYRRLLSNAFVIRFLCVVVRTAGTIVSMDWNKRISSLDERETTLEYIEESTLFRVLSILSAFERRRRVITVLSTNRLPSFPRKLKKQRGSLTKLRRLLSVRWKLNSIRIQQQQRDCRY